MQSVFAKSPKGLLYYRSLCTVKPISSDKCDTSHVNQVASYETGKSQSLRTFLKVAWNSSLAFEVFTTSTPAEQSDIRVFQGVGFLF